MVWVERSKLLVRKTSNLSLKGDWENYRDLHIEPDWLLLYKTDDANLWLIHTGTRSDIFGA